MGKKIELIKGNQGLSFTIIHRVVKVGLPGNGTLNSIKMSSQVLEFLNYLLCFQPPVFVDTSGLYLYTNQLHLNFFNFYVCFKSV